MANKATSTTCTCHSCDNPYFVRAQIIAKSAGSPAYRFGIDESVSLPGNQHGFVRDIRQACMGHAMLLTFTTSTTIWMMVTALWWTILSTMMLSTHSMSMTLSMRRFKHAAP